MIDQPKAVYNLSPRTLHIAQIIEHLPPGSFSIRLEKPELEALSWHVEVVRNDTLCDKEIPKREVAY